MISSPSAGMPFYLSVFSLVRDDLPQFGTAVTRLRGDARDVGWIRTTFAFSVTGLVDEWLEFYRIPQAAPLLDNFARLEQEEDPRNNRQILDFCQTRRMELTRAMPYDPVPAEPGSEEEESLKGFLLYSILELKPGQEQSLIDAMTQRPQLRDWRLVSASKRLTQPRHVVHLWQFEDAQTLYDLLEDNQYAVIDRCCERQSHRLLRARG